MQVEHQHTLVRNCTVVRLQQHTNRTWEKVRDKGAVWWDMRLADALVSFFLSSFLPFFLSFFLSSVLSVCTCV